MPYDRDLELKKLTAALQNSFRQWDHLFQNGGSDPFWADGVNLNLVRNHIIFYKRDMEALARDGAQELSLFPTVLPDIYYRDTPDPVSPNYMAKADEIRERSTSQLALYEADPNFQYLLENHNLVFPKGETRATKAAGLSIWSSCGLSRYRECVESGDLVSMRRDFYEPYESKAVRWAETAAKLRAYLSMEHRQEDDSLVQDELYEDEDFLDDADPALADDETPSLDEVIKEARAQLAPEDKIIPPRAEQLSLF